MSEATMNLSRDEQMALFAEKPEVDPHGDRMDEMQEEQNPFKPVEFMMAGNAYFTIQNARTGNRFTYRVTAPMKNNRRDFDATVRFVSVLTGSDNNSDYSYVGCIFTDGNAPTFRTTKKSRISPDAPSVKAFDWTFRRLVESALPECIEVHHEGRCGRCGRRLTVPESIESGYGPECIHKVA